MYLIYEQVGIVIKQNGWDVINAYDCTKFSDIKGIVGNTQFSCPGMV